MDLPLEILETLGLHRSRLENRPVPFVLDGRNVKRRTPPLQDRFARGSREFQLVLGISLRQIDWFFPRRSTQELHKKLGVGEIAFGGLSKGARFLGRPGFGEHMRPRLIQVSLDVVALHLQVVGDLGQVNSRLEILA